MIRGVVILILALGGWGLAGAAPEEEIPPLRPPLQELPPTYWAANREKFFATAVAAVAVGSGAFLLLRRALQRRPLSPEEMARLSLDELRRSGVQDLSAVSQATRRGFAGMYGLPDGEMTTAEFCKAMEERALDAGPAGAGRGDSALVADRDIVEKVHGFLNRCDARKFQPGRSLEPWDAAGEALGLIDDAGRRGKRADSRQSGA